MAEVLVEVKVFMMDKAPVEKFFCCVVDWREKNQFLVEVSALIPGVGKLRNPGAQLGERERISLLLYY